VRIIPILAAALGIVLGITAFYAVPAIMPASNIFVAILVGGSSGLAATGTHQVFKQLLSTAIKDIGEKLDKDKK
jgi:hypothetical protein